MIQHAAPAVVLAAAGLMYLVRTRGGARATGAATPQPQRAPHWAAAGCASRAPMPLPLANPPARACSTANRRSAASGGGPRAPLAARVRRAPRPLLTMTPPPAPGPPPRRAPQKGNDSAPITETLLTSARALAQHLGVDLVGGPAVAASLGTGVALLLPQAGCRAAARRHPRGPRPARARRAPPRAAGLLTPPALPARRRRRRRRRASSCSSPPRPPCSSRACSSRAPRRRRCRCWTSRCTAPPSRGG
jgi:hypothetical protein